MSALPLWRISWSDIYRFVCNNLLNPSSKLKRTPLVPVRGFHSWVLGANAAELVDWKQLSHPYGTRHWEHSWNSLWLCTLQVWVEQRPPSGRHTVLLSARASSFHLSSNWAVTGIKEGTLTFGGTWPVGHLTRGVLRGSVTWSTSQRWPWGM